MAGAIRIKKKHCTNYVGGMDGSDAGTVENAAPVGTTVECIACHNEATIAMDSVTFPSGVEISGHGDEARCMQCHQGRSSGSEVDAAIADANLTDVDTASDALGFINIHYYAAAATRWGGVAEGGYQYEGKTYDAKFAHVEGIDVLKFQPSGCRIGPYDGRIKIYQVAVVKTCALNRTDAMSVVTCRAGNLFLQVFGMLCKTFIV